MNPEWLPVLGLLLAGLFAAVLAVRALFSRDGWPAVALGAGSVAAITLAVSLGRPSFPPDKIRPLTPASRVIAAIPDDPDTNSTSLVLGSVVLRVAAARRYDLALDGRRFLRLETDRTGLRFTCDAGSDSARILVHIRENRFVYPSWPEAKRNRPDPHTFVLRSETKDIFRVRYADPHRIEVMGEFHAGRSDGVVEIRDAGGIHWPGGGAPPGTTIDLRHFGRGTVDFEKSGLVRVKRG